MMRRVLSYKYFFIFIFCTLLYGLSAGDFYWEKPVPLTNSESRFPTAAYNQDTSIIVWQDIEKTSEQQGNIWISAQVLSPSTGGYWLTKKKLAGPFAYSGEVPHLFSAAVSSNNVICICVLADPKTISVFTSDNFGLSFNEVKLTQTGSSVVAPRVFRGIAGGFVLFATQGSSQSFSLKLSHSADGKTWSNFNDFAPARDFNNSFVPDFTVLPSGREVVVFQSTYIANNRVTYQLYSSYSDNKGAKWSEPVLITEQFRGTEPITAYTNQRPFLHVFEDTLYLAWERSRTSSNRSAVVIAPLTDQGAVGGPIEQLSPRQVAAFQPVLFTYNENLCALWVDTRRGVENIYFASQKGKIWDENRISASGLTSVFGTPLVSGGGKDLHIFWEQKNPKNYRVTRLSTDRSVKRPVLKGVSFKDGERSAGGKISARLEIPEDSSGIAAYSWILTKDNLQEPPKEFMQFPTKPSIAAFVEEDGLWYLKARIMDHAGNWSESTSITYFKDTKPPEKPEFFALDAGDDGYMNSNTFKIAWKNASGDDDLIAGYTYSLQYVASVRDYKNNPQKYTADALAEYKTGLPAKIVSTAAHASWTNQDNGVYLFSVSAVDVAGNIGKKAVIPVYLNRYIPYTAVSAVYPQTDVYGNTSLTIIGKGFGTDGNISAVYLDRNGKAPYDIMFEYKSGGFKILSDRKISGIEFAGLESGTYRVGLLHPRRGLYMTEPLLSVNEFGTVKTGDYAYRFQPAWKEYSSKYRYTIQMSDVLLLIVFILAASGFFFVSRHMFITIRDSLAVKREVRALILGDSMLSEGTQKVKELKQRGMSLKYKMMFFTSILVLLLTLFVSIPLGIIFVRTQESTLAKGLEDRVAVLMESFASGVKNYMPGQNMLELGLLLNQSQSMPEIQYVTILGLPADGRNTNIDYVWASNDPDIEAKIDSKTLILGASRFVHEETVSIGDRISRLNEEAEKQIGGISFEIVSLSAEGLSLALKTDKASIERRNDIQSVSTQLTQTLNRALNDLSKRGSGSFPEFNNVRLSRDVTEYLFYKPVLYRRGTEQIYVRSVIVLKLSTEELIKTVYKATLTVVFTASAIALVAIIIGIAGSLVLASIIIKPIRRLASHVVMIRDTGDKAELAGKDIPVTAGDEIGLLSENVNDMTRALVEAAVNENMLLGGKEVQRAFLPLDEVSVGGKKVKQSVGRLDTPYVQFFGYYEGAKGVSGDYFDYRKLDDRHFAVIKVDVSGKGSPAALIMAEVAALFTEYFNGWSIRKNGTDLSPLVYKINDHLVNRNLFGKFAAFTLAIFDSVAGDFYFCNAGDNLIHVYDASVGQKKTITLTATPTAGAFPSDLVEMRGGYPVEKVHLDSGDILFLYTDGIEEAKRLYRDREGVALKFRDETDILVTREEQDGYAAYLKLYAEQQKKKEGKAYLNFEKTIPEDLLKFLQEKSSDISDPKKYMHALRRPKDWVSLYEAQAEQTETRLHKTKILSYIKSYNKLTVSKEFVDCIKKMKKEVYDYIVYMGQKGASIVDGEEMSAERVHDIIEAVFKRRTYSLVKKRDPQNFSKDDVFEFDFSDCSGTPEEGVMALVCVEKIFRMYKDPHADAYDHAVVDKKIDAFLKEHFVQYPVYCSHQAEHFQPGLRDEYMFYTHVEEDEQFDDLTLVGIKKK
ncbi:SpoIIE family protein phosphatase [Treponema sp. OMZ 840]|uniref:PP2C family protein-serine/threonine phosphatase n=1 Tax=Treponema sp. OMZ 840 TaxID=244313 RepID=UPI003D909054